jgi:uncharacterized protein YcbK (DUF882 family)
MLLSRREFLVGATGAALLAMAPQELWARKKTRLAKRKKILLPKNRLIKPKKTLVFPRKGTSVCQGAKRQFLGRDKSLWLHNVHTGQTSKITFFAEGHWQKSGLKEIAHLLRDHRSNQHRSMDLNLILLMASLKDLLDYRKPFDVISGYRCAATNERLRKAGRGVAKNSYHVKGQAVDIHFRGLTLQRAHKAACALAKGGVGMYPSSGFVHMDVRGHFVKWHGA